MEAAAVMAKRKYVKWDEVPIIMGTEDAAGVLDVHVNTIKNLVKNGELPHFNVGRVWRFRKEDLMKFAGVIPDEAHKD
jgi:excisionase family DNA binding protein